MWFSTSKPFPLPFIGYYRYLWDIFVSSGQEEKFWEERKHKLRPLSVWSTTKLLLGFKSSDASDYFFAKENPTSLCPKKSFPQLPWEVFGEQYITQAF